MNFKIEVINGSPQFLYERPENRLKNNILLALAMKKGSWFFKPDYGIKTDDITGITDKNQQLLKDRIEEALQPQLDSGIAEYINVFIERDTDIYRFNVRIVAKENEKNTFTITGFLPVGGASDGFSFP